MTRKKQQKRQQQQQNNIKILYIDCEYQTYENIFSYNGGGREIRKAHPHYEASSLATIFKHSMCSSLLNTFVSTWSKVNILGALWKTFD